MLYIYSAFIHSWILALAVLSVIHVSVLVQLLWHGIIIGKIFHIRFAEFHFLKKIQRAADVNELNYLNRRYVIILL